MTEFQYLMKLHYSQTEPKTSLSANMFQYLMKLHYSQTEYAARSCYEGFSTL